MSILYGIWRTYWWQNIWQGNTVLRMVCLVVTDAMSSTTPAALHTLSVLSMDIHVQATTFRTVEMIVLKKNWLRDFNSNDGNRDYTLTESLMLGKTVIVCYTNGQRWSLDQGLELTKVKFSQDLKCCCGLEWDRLITIIIFVYTSTLQLQN